MSTTIGGLGASRRSSSCLGALGPPSVASSSSCKDNVGVAALWPSDTTTAAPFDEEPPPETSGTPSSPPGGGRGSSEDATLVGLEELGRDEPPSSVGVDALGADRRLRSSSTIPPP
mmetsp:Transcript_9851/g.40037  ORF Transcript_9851/g.40037 Transcript_9851/m.40037 type:complete len:116 (-) Transcript_9851:258-605(-)